MTKVEKMEQRLAKLIEQRIAYEKLHSIHEFKSDYIGCKKCGSKLKISYIYGESCPLCHNELRSQSTIDAISNYSKKISALSSAIKLEGDPVRRKGIGSEYEINVRDDEKDPVKDKIKEYLIGVYGDEFKFSYGAKSENNILMISQDWIYSKTYTGAKYDAYLFDEKGRILLTYKSFITGSSQSSFFVDDVDFDETNFRVYVRSHLHERSKCDDEYKAVWLVDFDTHSIRLTKNPFVFTERWSEHYGSIYNDKNVRSDGIYYMIEDLDGHNALEVSLDEKLRNKLYQ